MENPATGALSGVTITVPKQHESNRGSVETIIWSQVTPGTATGSLNSKGQLSLVSQFQVVVAITAPLTFNCLSKPVTMTFTSTTRYNATTGTVTVKDMTFSVPNFANAPGYTCGPALSELNATFPGSAGTQMTLNLHGTLLVPPTPTIPSATTLNVSPTVPAATGGAVAGQPTVLTATAAPGGPHGVTGSVQFLDTTVALGTPVALVPGSGTAPATATLTTRTLPVGTNHLKAAYGGNGVYLTSSSSVTNYQVAAAPTVNINFPSSVTTTTNGTTGGFTSTATGQFSGVIADPVGSGPNLTRARLTFSLSGLIGLTAATVHLAVCTSNYTTCTTTFTRTGTISATTSITSHWGGATSTSSFTLVPGTQKTIYFKLAFTSKTTTKFGPLVITTTLSTVTTAGTTVKASKLSSQVATVLALRSGGPRVPATFTITQTVAGTKTVTSVLMKTTRQGYNVIFTVTVKKTSAGPTPSGIVTLYKAPKDAPSTKKPIGSLSIPGTKTLTLYATKANWTAGTSYQITAAYSGDPFYQAKTATPVTLHITTPVTGVPYVCTQTLPLQQAQKSNLRAYVTSVSGGTLPASAPAGSALPLTNVVVTLEIDHSGFNTPTLNGLTAMDNVSAAVSPEGSAEGVLSTGGAPSTKPSAYNVAVDTGAHVAYVTDNRSGVVAIFNELTKRTLGMVTVGQGPRGLTFVPSAGMAGEVFVANFTSGTVSVIDAKTRAVVQTIAVGTHPTGVVLNPANDRVYVTNNGSNSVSIIDPGTETVVGTITGTIRTNPSGIAVDPTIGPTGTLYLDYSKSATSQLTTISAASGGVTHALTLPNTSATKHALAVDPVTHKIYVPSTTRLFVISGTTTNGPHLTRTITNVSSARYGVAVDPQTGPTVGGVRQGTVWLTRSTLFRTTIYVLNGTGTSVLKTLHGGWGPYGIAIDPSLGSGGTIDIANFNTAAQTVSMFDATTGDYTGALHLSAGWTTIPFSRSNGSTTRQPLTMNGTLHVSGTVGLGTASGDLTVGLTSFNWTAGYETGAPNYSCVPVTKPATIGTVKALPLAKPSVTTQPTDQTVNVGTAATFGAAATAVPAATVQWQSSTDGGGTWVTVPGATSTSYTTPATTDSDNGTQYRAVFTNGSGSTTSTAATLTVDIPPTVTAQPADQTVTAGTTATFTASATSRPAPGVQWQMSTNGGKSWSDVPAATSPTLTVSSTKKDDGNQYRAVFSNPLGKATSTAATLSVTTGGYRLVGADGAVYAYGNAPFYGSMGGQPLNQPIVGLADTPSGKGYWEVAADGGIFSFGNATFYGSTGGMTLNKPIVGMASTPTGGGYWEVGADGGIFAYGNAPFYGSTGGMTLNKPIVGMATTPNGKGYWLVASDGGIFAYGDAAFYGSTGSIALNKPIVGMATTPNGKGYWLVASDGGIFAYGNASFYGSGAGGNGSTAVVGMAASGDGGGYWMATASGAVIPFGDAPLAGSAAGMPLNAPVVGITG